MAWRNVPRFLRARRRAYCQAGYVTCVNNLAHPAWLEPVEVDRSTKVFLGHTDGGDVIDNAQHRGNPCMSRVQDTAAVDQYQVRHSGASAHFSEQFEVERQFAKRQIRRYVRKSDFATNGRGPGNFP